MREQVVVRAPGRPVSRWPRCCAAWHRPAGRRPIRPGRCELARPLRPAAPPHRAVAVEPAWPADAPLATGGTSRAARRRVPRALRRAPPAPPVAQHRGAAHRPRRRPRGGCDTSSGPIEHGVRRRGHRLQPHAGAARLAGPVRVHRRPGARRRLPQPRAVRGARRARRRRRQHGRGDRGRPGRGRRPAESGSRSGRRRTSCAARSTGLPSQASSVLVRHATDAGRGPDDRDSGAR